MRKELFRFEPWVGSNYEKGIENKKILILGESHYCCDPDECNECNECNNQTIDIIKKQINEHRVDFESNPFHTKLAKLFLKKGPREHISLDEKKLFWNSVAFYNYIQMSVGEKARIAPTEEMFEKSWEPFQYLIENITPDFILIVSQRLWEGMPGEAAKDWPTGPVKNSYYYSGKTKSPLCIVINHPSTSHFSYDISEVIYDALSSINK